MDDLMRLELEAVQDMSPVARLRYVRAVQRQILAAVTSGDMTVPDLLDRIDTEIVFTADAVVARIKLRRLLVAIPEIGRGRQRRWRKRYLPVPGGKRIGALTPPQRNAIRDHPGMM